MLSEALAKALMEQNEMEILEDIKFTPLVCEACSLCSCYELWFGKVWGYRGRGKGKVR